jgi:hypothetical protein
MHVSIIYIYTLCVDQSATKRTKVGRYAKSRANEIAARRQSVWNFIATMEVPKVIMLILTVIIYVEFMC